MFFKVIKADGVLAGGQRERSVAQTWINMHVQLVVSAGGEL